MTASMKARFCLSVVLGVVCVGMAARCVPASAADAPDSGKVYELRVYHANPGKLDALHARFRDFTCKLFKKHGIELVGFWTPMQGEEAKNTLYYIIAFPSIEGRRRLGRIFGPIPSGSRPRPTRKRTACSSRRWTART